MAEQALQRASALAGMMKSGHYGVPDRGISITEIRDLTLWQVAFWSDTLAPAAAELASDSGIDGVPGFGQASGDPARAMIRIEPLKFWLFGASATSADSATSVALDLSHSRTHFRLTGPQAVTVLNSFLPLDLREEAFPINRVASSAMHHVGVTLWRSDAGYEFFVPRGFAVSIWELLYETSLQYGLTIE